MASDKLRAQKKAWYQAHRDEETIKQRERRSSPAGQAAWREYMRAYRAEHRDELNAKRRAAAKAKREAE